MGNAASRNEKHGKSFSRRQLSEEAAEQLQSGSTERRSTSASSRSSTSRKKYIAAIATTTTTAAATTTTTTLADAAAAESAEAAQQQRLRQTSTWSLGSLSGRLNWSFTGGASSAKNSFHNRNKSTRKSLTSLQQRRSKTVWHKPLTNAIFSSHFKEPSRNDQFHIEHLIAKGAFGVVFAVTDKNEKQPQQPISTIYDNKAHPSLVYALKVLKKSKIIEGNSVQQLKDEADIQKLCGHHPYIVQQVDLWQNRRNLHILSEYVPNGELFSKIAQFSTDLIRVYLAEIALAIDFLHHAGIIYRDAKPENILLTENYHIKLTDFGLSKWLKLGATTKTMCGTFQYMAPEILRGEPYGHAVDWWSLGIIVCQMFTQRTPDIHPFLVAALPSVAKIRSSRSNLVDAVVVADGDVAAVDVDAVDNVQTILRTGVDDPQVLRAALEAQSFLPSEVDSLPHEARDVLQRLLTVEPRQRIRSVLALQRIALYKNFKIDAKHLQRLHPLDIIAKDGIVIHMDSQYDEYSSALATEAFQGF